jgi:hypothetical protein
MYPAPCSTSIAAGLPLPGQTNRTSGPVPDDSWVRIVVWYWSTPAVVIWMSRSGCVFLYSATMASSAGFSLVVAETVRAFPPP